MDVEGHRGSGELKHAVVNYTQALSRKRIVQVVLFCIIFTSSLAWVVSILSRNLIRDGIHIDTAEGWLIRWKNRLGQFKHQVNMDPGPDPALWGGNRKRGRVYFQDNWEPVFSCPYERRLGHWGDGGKWICNPHLIPRPAIVYSLGSNNEFSFETAMQDYFEGHVAIHTFDFGNAPDTPAFVNYHKYFIGPDGVDKGGVISKSIKTILKELNHTRVDIFKIDIEGNEMTALLPLLESGEWPETIIQIQIELHLHDESWNTTPTEVDRFFILLSTRYQMEIFHKEPNIKFSGGDATEYSLVRVDWKTIMAGVHKNTK